MEADKVISTVTKFMSMKNVEGFLAQKNKATELVTTDKYLSGLHAHGDVFIVRPDERLVFPSA